MERIEELGKAINLLDPLLKGIAEYRNVSHVRVRAKIENETDFVYVEIDKGEYKVNVTCENIPSIIRSVVNVVALKF